MTFLPSSDLRPLTVVLWLLSLMPPIQSFPRDSTELAEVKGGKGLLGSPWVNSTLDPPSLKLWQTGVQCWTFGCSYFIISRFLIFSTSQLLLYHILETGNTITHLVPSLGTGSRKRSPRFFFATNRAIGNPKPVPFGFDEKERDEQIVHILLAHGTPALKISTLTKGESAVVALKKFWYMVSQASMLKAILQTLYNMISYSFHFLLPPEQLIQLDIYLKISGTTGLF